MADVCVASVYGETAFRMLALMGRSVRHLLPFSKTVRSKMVMRPPSTPMRNVMIHVEPSGPARSHIVSEHLDVDSDKVELG